MRFAVALPFLLLFLIPVSAHAALVNINTAGVAELDTLPGIGPAKAQAIIDYRTTNGPFAQIADIQNVSGIGDSTYADIKGLITVGGTTDSAMTDDDAAATTSADESADESDEPQAAKSTYRTDRDQRPPPFFIGNNRVIIAGAPAEFVADIRTARENLPRGAHMVWSFGDGAAGRGERITHTYTAPGEYMVVAELRLKGGKSALESFVATVIASPVRIVSADRTGIALVNDGTQPVDLSRWQLGTGEESFVVPENTYLLPGKTVVFPTSVTRLPSDSLARVSFPSGALALVGPEREGIPSVFAGSKPLARAQSLSGVAEVSTNRAPAPAYDEEELAAPRETGDTAVPRGAAVVAEALPEEDESVLKSGWTWGFASLLALSAGAFIFF